MLEQARHLGDDIIGPALRDMQSRHPCIGEVRGLGVFWAVELVKDTTTREADGRRHDGQGRRRLQGEGHVADVAANRIHVVPPCNAPDDLVREGLAILDDALTVADDAMS